MSNNGQYISHGIKSLCHNRSVPVGFSFSMEQANNQQTIMDRGNMNPSNTDIQMRDQSALPTPINIFQENKSS
jgi:hypothetical protein